ncbi:unnamed protein product, partial [Ectocarpus sp. 12 AP-2014]
PQDTICECPWLVKDAETRQMVLECARLATLVLLVQSPPGHTWSQYMQASKRARVPALSLWSFKSAQRFFSLGASASPSPARATVNHASRTPRSSSIRRAGGGGGGGGGVSPSSISPKLFARKSGFGWGARRLFSEQGSAAAGGEGVAGDDGESDAGVSDGGFDGDVADARSTAGLEAKEDCEPLPQPQEQEQEQEELEQEEEEDDDDDEDEDEYERELELELEHTVAQPLGTIMESSPPPSSPSSASSLEDETILGPEQSPAAAVGSPGRSPSIAPGSTRAGVGPGPAVRDEESSDPGTTAAADPATATSAHPLASFQSTPTASPFVTLRSAAGATTKTEDPAAAAGDRETAAAVEVAPAGPLSEEPTASAAADSLTAEWPDEAGEAEGSLSDVGGLAGESLHGVEAAAAAAAAEAAGSPSELFAELDSPTGARAMAPPPSPSSPTPPPPPPPPSTTPRCSPSSPPGAGAKGTSTAEVLTRLEGQEAWERSANSKMSSLGVEMVEFMVLPGDGRRVPVVVSPCGGGGGGRRTPPPPAGGRYLVSPLRAVEPGGALRSMRESSASSSSASSSVGAGDRVSLRREELAVAKQGATRLGSLVKTKSGQVGTVRFCGLTEFATGLWLGLELDSPEGKNDGSNQLKRYFTCPEQHGLFVRPTNVTLVSAAPPSTSPPVAPAAAPAAATASSADTPASTFEDGSCGSSSSSRGGGSVGFALGEDDRGTEGGGCGLEVKITSPTPAVGPRTPPRRVDGRSPLTEVTEDRRHSVNSNPPLSRSGSPTSAAAAVRRKEQERTPGLSPEGDKAVTAAWLLPLPLTPSSNAENGAGSSSPRSSPPPGSFPGLGRPASTIPSMESFSDALVDAETESTAAAVVAAATVAAAVDTAVATAATATDTEAAEGSGVEGGRGTIAVSPVVDSAADAAGAEEPRAASVLPSSYSGQSEERSGEGLGLGVADASPTPTYPAFTDPLSATTTYAPAESAAGNDAAPTTITPAKVVQKKVKLVGDKGSAPVLGAADVASTKKGAVAEKIALMEATFSSTAAAAAASTPRAGPVTRKGIDSGWAELNATGSWSSNGSWRSAGGSTPADTDPIPKDGGDAGAPVAAAAAAVVDVFSLSKVDDSAATAIPPTETEESSNAAGSVAGATCSAPSSLASRTDGPTVPSASAAATGDGASAADVAAAIAEGVPGDGSTAVTVAVESNPGSNAPRPHTAPCGDAGGPGGSGDAFGTTASESGVADVADAELGAAAEPDIREGISSVQALTADSGAGGLARDDAPDAQALGAEAAGELGCQGGVLLPSETNEGEGVGPGHDGGSESDGEEVEVGQSERGSTAGVGDVSDDGLDVSDGVLPPSETDNGSLKHGHEQSRADGEGVSERESESESECEIESIAADAGEGDAGDDRDASVGSMAPLATDDNICEHACEKSEADGEEVSEKVSSAADAGVGDVDDDPDASAGVLAPSATDNTSQHGHEESEADGEAVGVGESEGVAADPGHVGDDLDEPDVMMMPFATDEDAFQHGHGDSEAEGEAVGVGVGGTGMGHVDDDLDVSETLAAIYETEDDIASSGDARDNAHGESEAGGSKESVREPSPTDGGGHGVGGVVGSDGRRATGRGKRLAACCLGVAVPIAVIVMMLAAGAALLARPSATPTIIPATLDRAFGAAMEAATRVMPKGGVGVGGKMTERLRGALRDAYLSVVDPGAPGPTHSNLFSGSEAAEGQEEEKNSAPASADESLPPRRRGKVGPPVLSKKQGRVRPAQSEPTARAGREARSEDGGVAAAGERPERRRLPLDGKEGRAVRRRQEMTTGGGGSGGELGRELRLPLDDGGTGAGAGAATTTVPTKAAVSSVSIPSPDGVDLEETATAAAAAAATDGKALPDDLTEVEATAATTPTLVAVYRAALADRPLDARASAVAEGTGAATSAVARGPVPEAAVPPEDGGSGGGATSTEEALSGAARDDGDHELPGTAAEGPSTAAAIAVLMSSPTVGVAGEAGPPKRSAATTPADDAESAPKPTTTGSVTDGTSDGIGMGKSADDDKSESDETAEGIAAVAAAAAAATESLTAGDDSATDNLDDDGTNKKSTEGEERISTAEAAGVLLQEKTGLVEVEEGRTDAANSNLGDGDDRDTSEKSTEGEERMAVEETAGVVPHEEAGSMEVGDEDDRDTGKERTEGEERIAGAEAAGAVLLEETGSVDVGEGRTDVTTAGVVEGGGIQEGVDNEDEEREDVAEMGPGAGEENNSEVS